MSVARPESALRAAIIPASSCSGSGAPVRWLRAKRRSTAGSQHQRSSILEGASTVLAVVVGEVLGLVLRGELVLWHTGRDVDLRITPALAGLMRAAEPTNQASWKVVAPGHGVLVAVGRPVRSEAGRGGHRSARRTEAAASQRPDGGEAMRGRRGPTEEDRGSMPIVGVDIGSVRSKRVGSPRVSRKLQCKGPNQEAF